MLEGCRASGAVPMILEGDYSEESGAKLTAALLGSAEPPTAILYDNDVMALAGLGAAKELGVGVPERLSLIAWDDSTLCRITHPPLTAMSHNIIGYGAEVTNRLLDLLNGARPQAHLYSTPLLIVRDSSGPPPV